MIPSLEDIRASAERDAVPRQPKGIVLEFTSYGFYACDGIGQGLSLPLTILGALRQAGCEQCPRFAVCRMSHWTQVETSITDLRALEAACLELGLTFDGPGIARGIGVQNTISPHLRTPNNVRDSRARLPGFLRSGSPRGNHAAVNERQYMRKKIVNYIKAGYPGLYIVSHEESRIEAELRLAAKDTGFSLYAWTVTKGVFNAIKGDTLPDTQEPILMLEQFGKLPERSMLIAEDLHGYIAEKNPVFLRTLKEALQTAKTKNRVLIIVGCVLELPPELAKELTVIEYALPDRDTLRDVAEAIAKSAKQELNGNTDAILDAATGLTTTEAENAFALSIVESKALVPDVIAREKASTIKKNGILEIVETRNRLEDIGGLDNLKAWLKQRRNAFTAKAKEFGLPTPKGLLMVGIPGCGKSLTAKATAGILGLPLLKLDAGKLFGSLVGESERNLRTAIQTAEAIAPCVLWLDEMEKGFSGSKSSGSTDGGTSSRVFGSFIQWMQEKTAPVFVVATANDVSQLPPEMLRKGRFDEMFFVDLPDIQERKAIWEIQIAKYGRKPSAFHLETLAVESEGWTGSEIEAVFCEALFAAFDQDTSPNTATVSMAAQSLVPLSRTMAQALSSLREWAKGRARSASAIFTANTEPKGRKLAA